MKMKQTGKVGRKLLSLALALALMAGFAPGMGMTAWADTALPADGSDAGNGLSYYVGYDMVQQGGTYEAADDNKGGASLFDRNPATKACIGFVGSYSVEFSYASEITPHNYYFRTGDDTSTQTARNPSAWKLEGKNTDNTWTVLDEKSKQTYTTDRNTEVKFGISNNTAYQTFRLTITANSSGRDDWPIGGKPTFQLSEFYMSGTIAPASSVASVTSGGTTTNYTDFASAVTAWNSAASGATLTLLADVTMANTINVSGTKILDLNGYGIKKTGSGRVLMVTNGANMTLHDSNATRTDTGANRPDGVSGGYITGGNTRNESGSCVRVESGSAFNMYGGTITGNTLENGGGAVLVIGGNFNMYGGIITGNKADNNCGGVWVHSKKGSTFNMYCGTITDNTLYDVNAQGVMTTSSNATIGDFDYSEYVAVTFDANGGTGSMPLQKVRKNTDTTIFANVNCSASGISDPAFSREGYDFAGWNTQADGEGTNYTAGTSTINISEATTLYAHWTAHVASVTSDGTTTNYTDFASAVTAWNSAASGATLTLLADVTTITINFSGTKTLDLNGHSLTGNGNGTVIKVNGGSLTVNGKNGTITGGKAVEGGAFFITSNGKVTLNDCTLKGNEATNVGDAFFIKSSGGGGSAIINNCTIIGRGKDKGAALWLQGHNNPDTSFTMNGGSISNFKIGVWVQGKTDLGTSMFTMNGGTISDNLIGVKNEGPNSKIIVSGDAIISNNDQKNLELNDGIKVTVNSALGKNAKIGIYMGNSGVFTNSTPTDYNGATKFTSDNASYAVGKNTDGQLFLGTPINSVAVTDITAPAATEALDTAAATSTEHVTLADSGAITWDPAAPQDGKAAYATEYTATVTATADDNYAFADGATATVNGETATVTKNDDGTLSIAYTFSKTALTPVTITATDKEVTYSADGIAIPVDGMFAITEGAGEATYSVTNGTGEGTFAEGKLTVTKCGTFTVKVSTAATETYAAGTETTATLTVNKADSTAATVTANNRTYDGTEQPLVTVEGEPTGGTMQYALGTETKATEQYTTSIPTATNAGTYYVWYKAVGDDNHEDTAPSCVTVNINKAEVTAPAIASKIYNAQLQTADVVESSLYSVTKNEGGTNVGSYDVVLTLTDSANYKWANSDEAAATLTFTITATSAGAVMPPLPTLSAVTYDSAKTLAYVTLPEGWSWADPTQVPTPAVGSYSAKLAVDDLNTNWSAVEGYDSQNHCVVRDLSLTVNKAEVALPTIQNKTYTGSVQTADVPGSTLYTVTANAGGTNVGSYDVVLTLTDAANYKWTDSEEAAKTLTFQITQEAATVATPTLNAVTYDPAKTLANVTLPDGWTWADNSIVPAVSNSGYAAVYTVPDDTNYDYSTVEGYSETTHKVTRTVSLTVNKASSTITKAPTANELTNNGTAQELVTPGAADGGDMYYVSTDTNAVPTEGWTTSIPTGTDAGTYYVWYKVVGDTDHLDVDPACVTVTIVEPSSNANLALGDDTTNVTVTGLDNLAEESAVDGKTVVVTMTVDKKDKTEVEAADSAAIETAADGMRLEYIDISLTKTVNGEESALTDTNTVLEIVVPYTLSNKTQTTVTVYRYHDGVATKLTEADTKADGTYRLDWENDLIYIYASKFSTYAIGFTPTYTVSGTLSGTFTGTVSFSLTGNGITKTASGTVMDGKVSYSFTGVPAGTYSVKASWRKNGRAQTLTFPVTVTAATS